MIGQAMSEFAVGYHIEAGEYWRWNLALAMAAYRKCKGQSFMDKTDLQILGAMFGAELENKLPYQSQSKRIAKLSEEGYCQPMTVHFGNHPVAIEVSGWQLTHLGRWTYCESCQEPPDDDAGAPNER